MDLSILDYVKYDGSKWICDIKCKNFDEHGYPIYLFEYRGYSYSIHYNTDIKKWIANCPSQQRFKFINLGPPRRFFPLPAITGESSPCSVGRYFTAWSEAYSSKIVPYSRGNYKKARNRTVWMLKDISMIILATARRLRINLPEEMLEIILSFLNIIVR